MWRSKLQKTTALSMAEAEYYSVSTAATEVLYLRNPLKRMGFVQLQPTPVYEDNTACIEWENNVISCRERAKHIDIRKHFAHEVIQNGHMKLDNVSTGGHLNQAAALPAIPGVCRRHLGSEGNNHLRDLRPQEGLLRQGYQVESRRP